MIPIVSLVRLEWGWYSLIKRVARFSRNALFAVSDQLSFHSRVINFVVVLFQMDIQTSTHFGRYGIVHKKV